MVKIHSTKSMHALAKFTIILFCISTRLQGQESEIDRLIESELKMTFPSIYFKHNSTDYTTMPYTTDSCFKYIALNIKDINSFVIWRDSIETDQLANKRIKKLKVGLNKYTPSKNIEINSMGKEQKISRHTIEKSNDVIQIQYLLSLNSVFDISKTRAVKKSKYTNHVMRPSIFCWGCWKSGFHLQTRMKLRKMEKRKKLT